ncbi:kinase-like protein [Glonium stellatum]|uniref:Kinase-like protein n=1 Tax=Glonium stellatum TaxID=574774 RepID=A0A8E2ESG9_9PEZI|nr:kinase-like protein [Glonium stellatum]
MGTEKIPDVVKDWKLIVTVADGLTKQTVSGSTRGRRRAQWEQQWKRKGFLGRGAYGSVWLEECISGDHDVPVRAVKQIYKAGPDSKPIDYNRELEAIMKFSHRKYSGCFVESYGWYECIDYVYITMEYFHLGDLSKHMKEPMHEAHASQITSQVLEGLSFMHENEFTHRDLKPNNILVVQKPPDEWWVKISDFGISKRGNDGLSFSTLKGTLGFIAPEMLRSLNRRKHTVDDWKRGDMWALGETTVRILTGGPTFPFLDDISAYGSNRIGFPIKILRSRQLSDEACTFIEGLMKASPEERLTAKAGLEHPWMKVEYSFVPQCSTFQSQP